MRQSRRCRTSMNMALMAIWRAMCQAGIDGMTLPGAYVLPAPAVIEGPLAFTLIVEERRCHLDNCLK